MTKTISEVARCAESISRNCFKSVARSETKQLPSFMDQTLGRSRIFQRACSYHRSSRSTFARLRSHLTDASLAFGTSGTPPMVSSKIQRAVAGSMIFIKNSKNFSSPPGSESARPWQACLSRSWQWTSKTADVPLDAVVWSRMLCMSW